jgi:hypothetical protein
MDNPDTQHWTHKRPDEDKQKTNRTKETSETDCFSQNPNIIE